MYTKSGDTGLAVGFAMGTLNTCVFMLVAVLLLHLGDGLRELLDGLSAVIGLAIFALLWVVTCYCTYRGWQEAPAESFTGTFSASVKWGAFNGVGFFGGLLSGVLAIAAVQALGEGDPDRIAGIIVFGLTAFGVGTILAGVVGLLFGMVFGLADLLLLKTVRMLTRVAT
jgi:hypothetical protein